MDNHGFQTNQVQQADRVSSASHPWRPEIFVLRVLGHRMISHFAPSFDNEIHISERPILESLEQLPEILTDRELWPICPHVVLEQLVTITCRRGLPMLEGILNATLVARARTAQAGQRLTRKPPSKRKQWGVGANRGRCPSTAEPGIGIFAAAKSDTLEKGASDSSVCFEVCRIVPDMLFFGLHMERDC